MKSSIVNRYRDSNFEIDIGRSSIWGNPFSHDKKSKAKFFVKTREEAVEKYEHWILAQPELICRLSELKGKVLGCYCLPLKCHGSFLCSLVNNFDENKEFSDESAFW